MRDSRDINLMYVKGLGPAKAKLLKEELGLASVYDLLHHFPTHYVDRSQIYRIADFEGEMQAAVQVRGRFVSFSTQGEGARMRLIGLFTDGSATMEVVWFQRIK